MHNPGYSKRVVDEIIMREEVLPVIKLDPHLVQDGFLKATDPDWKSLFSVIKKNYNKEFAYRNMWQAKIIWYHFYKDYSNWAKYFIKRFERYGTDTLNWDHIPALNDAAWTIFLKQDNVGQLKKAMEWEKAILRRLPEYNSPYYEVMCGDTYANLLYKIGSRQEAIQIEEKLVALTKNISIMAEEEKKGYKATLEKMKRGERTW
jgi:tetratricopeptide (TPR) repeat protein